MKDKGFLTWFVVISLLLETVWMVSWPVNAGIPPTPPQTNPLLNGSSGEWTLAFGGAGNEQLYALDKTIDGGSVVAGSSDSFTPGNTDAWIIKRDAWGTALWQETLSLNDHTVATTIVATSDGSYLVAGYAYSNQIIDWDAWAVKLNDDGNIAWQYRFSGSGVDNPTAIQETSDGGAIVAGWTSSFGAGDADLWLLKLNSDGTVAWESTVGGAADDYANAVRQTSDGGYLAAGYTYSFGSGEADAWVLKLDSNGIVIWQKSYGDAGFEFANDIQATGDGGYVLVGAIFPSLETEDSEGWIVKLDNSGAVVWQKGVGGGSSDGFQAVQETASGHYLIGGWTASFGGGGNDLWLLDFDGSGGGVWQKTYGQGAEERGQALALTDDGGILAAGDTRSLGAGGSDYWLLKLDGQGVIAACAIGVESNAVVYDTAVAAVNTNGVAQTPSANVSLATAVVQATEAAGISLCRVWSLTTIYALAGDNDPSNLTNLADYFQPMMDNFISATAGKPGLVVIFLADLDGQGDTVIHVIQDGLDTPIDGLPDDAGILNLDRDEYNMASGADLGAFLLWAQNNYPAHKTLFSFIGHGSFLVPNVDNDDIIHLFPDYFAPRRPYTIEVDPGFTDVHPVGFITPHTVGEALSMGTQDGTNPIDILDLTHCFAASVEEFYETANAGGASPYADIIIGSPNYTYSSPDMAAQSLMNLDPDADAATIANVIIAAYDAVLNQADLSDGDDDVEHPRLIVAVDSSQLAAFKDEMDGMSLAMLSAFDNDPAGTKDALLAAYLGAGSYYDTTFCAPDWTLATPDALVDVGAFLQSVAGTFGASTDIGTHATAAYNLVSSAVITRSAHSGTPWFAPPVAPTWTLTNTERIGLALYADVQGQPDNSGDTVTLPWVPLYTDASVITVTNALSFTWEVANDYPYAFVRDGAAGITWSDVLQRYWEVRQAQDGVTLITQPCLTRLPASQQEAELSAESITSPISGTITVGVPILPTVEINTDRAVINPVVTFEISIDGSRVYTNSIAAGYLLTGTHGIEASYPFTPTVAGSLTLSATVDPDNRFWETNELDNIAVLHDEVFENEILIVTVTMPEGGQWLTHRDVTLTMSSTLPIHALDIQVYQYAPGTDAQTQAPVLLDDHHDDAPIFNGDDYTFTLPDTIRAGLLTLHVWSRSNGRPTPEPSVLHLNYAPDSHVLDTNDDTYRYHADGGQAITLTLSVLVGEASLFVWEPHNFWAARRVNVNAGITQTLVISPTRAGDYQLRVEGQVSGTQYTIRAHAPAPADDSLLWHNLPAQQHQRAQYRSPVPQVGDYQCVAVRVNAGSNLISIPFETNDMRLATLFPDALALLMPGGPVTETLHTGQGYVVIFDRPYQYALCGAPVTPQVIAVTAGWNFVGAFDTPVSIMALTTNPPGARQSSFLQLVNGGWSPVSLLQPGKGYLVRFGAPATLLFPP